jgi:phospholipid/cholesterol/gamma-HCH transport system substrate-binding protein
MKYFSERNPVTVGAVGVVVVAGLVVASLTYSKLPLFNNSRDYSAYFAEAGGLLTGTAVQVSGLKAGKVTSIALDGPRVLVKFEVDRHIRLGDRTEVAIKTKSLLGAKILEVTPRGDGRLSRPIPLERTTAPYQLPDALGDLATTISGNVFRHPGRSENCDGRCRAIREDAE